MSPITRWRLASVVFTSGLAIAMIGCGRTTPVEGEGRLDPSGRILLTEQGTPPATVAHSRPVQTGDLIEVVDGTAKVTLPGGDVLELQPRSVLFFNRGPELRRGDILVTATRSTSLVRAAGSRVTVSGAARITLAPALRVVSYEGSASLASGGSLLEVPALRSADVSLVGLVPGRPSPLVIDRADPWVTRFLSQAADKEAALESRSRGFTNQVDPIAAASARYYRGVLPQLAVQPGFQQDGVDRLGTQQGGAVRSGEVLLGSAIALRGSRGTFAERLAGAAEFRAQGATWALVAVDQRVQSFDALLDVVDGAINGASLELAAPPPTQPTVPTTRPIVPAPTTTRVPVTSPAPATPTTRPPTRTTTPTRPPATLPPPIQLGPLTGATIDPVVALLDGLLNGR